MKRSKAMVELLTLRNLLSGPENRIIACQQDQTFTVQDLRLSVYAWLGVLEPLKGQRWAVYHHDCFDFLAILMALWHLERTACIPGDNRPGTVQRLAASVDGFVGEFEAVPESSPHAAISADPALLMPPNWFAPEAQFPALEIYTSGSTGQPKPISKTFQQLEREAETLEAQWPSQPDSVVLATVSHQHLYGMTFRLFWPLASGRAFERSLCEYTEDVFHHALCYKSFSLVSSPSHLGRMNTSVDWARVAGGCDSVVSSAAPLLGADSLNVSALLAAPVREIYGSSETGAIAWRCQQSRLEDACWRSLPGVILSATGSDGTLLNSPYLNCADGINLADQLNFNEDGSFRLEGRLDSIVKVEGKRLSLLEIERQLLKNSLIKQAKALTIKRKRTEIAVVLELTVEGERALKHQGRKALIKTLKTPLAEHFEAVLLPRRWRFVTQMPYNPQGKLPLESLRNMFEKESVKWPVIVSEEVHDSQVLMECEIPADLIYFDGHFEDNPILPGIVQIHWAEAFGRRLLPIKGRFIRLEVIKFQMVIVPLSCVTLSFNYDEIKQKLSFEYRSDRGVHSSGRICFA